MELVLILAAYLIGSIPFGVLVARHYKVDLRTAGSGNIGATNALRVIGKKAGALTLAGDVLKGTLAVAIAMKFGGRELGFLAAAMAITGHDFSVFTGFKGGKGVATSLGVMLPLEPMFALMAVIVWALTVVVWRYSSLGAIISFSALPILVLAFERGDKALWALSVFIMSLALVKHRTNIIRLIKGEEPKIGARTA